MNWFTGASKAKADAAAAAAMHIKQLHWRSVGLYIAQQNYSKIGNTHATSDVHPTITDYRTRK